MRDKVATAIMRPMDRSIAWRAALLQALLVAAVAVVLAACAAALVLRGLGLARRPGAWGACALVGAVRWLRLPLGAGARRARRCRAC